MLYEFVTSSDALVKLRKIELLINSPASSRDISSIIPLFNFLPNDSALLPISIPCLLKNSNAVFCAFGPKDPFDASRNAAIPSWF